MATIQTKTISASNIEFANDSLTELFNVLESKVADARVLYVLEPEPESVDSGTSQTQDGYIKNGTLTQRDPITREVLFTATTDEYGNAPFLLSPPVLIRGVVYLEVTGGIDISTNDENEETFVGMFAVEDIQYNKKLVLNPLTTLVSSYAAKHGILKKEELQKLDERFAEKLGIRCPDIHDDYIKNKNVGCSKLATEIYTLLSFLTNEFGNSFEESALVADAILHNATKVRFNESSFIEKCVHSCETQCKKHVDCQTLTKKIQNFNTSIEKLPVFGEEVETIMKNIAKIAKIRKNNIKNTKSTLSTDDIETQRFALSYDEVGTIFEPEDSVGDVLATDAPTQQTPLKTYVNLIEKVPGHAIASSYSSETTHPSKAFNFMCGPGNENVWMTGETGETKTHNIGYVFEKPVSIVSYRIWCRSEDTQTPLSWRLLGFVNEYDTDGVLLDTRRGYTKQQWNLRALDADETYTNILDELCISCESIKMGPFKKYVLEFTETNGPKEKPLEIAGIDFQGNEEEEPLIISRYIAFIDNLTNIPSDEIAKIKTKIQSHISTDLQLPSSFVSVLTLENSQLQVTIDKHKAILSKDYSQNRLTDLLKSCFQGKSKTELISINSFNIFLVEHEQYQHIKFD